MKIYFSHCFTLIDSCSIAAENLFKYDTECWCSKQDSLNLYKYTFPHIIRQYRIQSRINRVFGEYIYIYDRTKEILNQWIAIKLDKRRSVIALVVFKNRTI